MGPDPGGQQGAGAELNPTTRKDNPGPREEPEAAVRVLGRGCCQCPLGCAKRRRLGDRGFLERTAGRLVNQASSIPSSSLFVIGAGSHA